ncbi:hypothetical protein ACRAWD_23985 [Caulobacter segnis]
MTSEKKIEELAHPELNHALPRQQHSAARRLKICRLQGISVWVSTLNRRGEQTHCNSLWREKDRASSKEDRQSARGFVLLLPFL